MKYESVFAYLPSLPMYISDSFVKNLVKAVWFFHWKTLGLNLLFLLIIIIIITVKQSKTKLIIKIKINKKKLAKHFIVSLLFGDVKLEL